MTPTASLLRLTTSILNKAGLDAVCILCAEPGEELVSSTLGFSAEFVPRAISLFHEGVGARQVYSGPLTTDVDHPLVPLLRGEDVQWFATIPLEVQDRPIGEVIVGTKRSAKPPVGLSVLESVVSTLCKNVERRCDARSSSVTSRPVGPVATPPPLPAVKAPHVGAVERRSLVEYLHEAIHQSWTGTIEARDDDEREIGHIVISEGRVAWACCLDQPETLGPFLWRLGRITRDQLTRAEEVYRQHGGKRKLGAILEEEGLMSRPVLRRCLLLHVRSALERMLGYPGARAAVSRARIGVDEKILFSPEEVLPLEVSNDLIAEWMLPDNTWVRSWYSLGTDNVVLGPLAKAPGYLGAAIISHNGEILAGHVAHHSVDLSLLAILVASMAESSARAVASTTLRAVEFILVECSQGWLAAHWLGGTLDYLVILLLGAVAEPNDARVLIKSQLPELERWVRDWTSGPHNGSAL